MIIHSCKPTVQLSSFVDYFWYLECSNPVNNWELSFPDGSTDIVIDLLEERVCMADASNRQRLLDSTLMCGPHSEYFFINHQNGSKVIGIHFKPGGVFPFLGFPLDELHNSLLSMDTIWGNQVVDLRDELLETTSMEERFRILDRRLMEFAVKPLSSHPVVQYALNKFENITHSVDISSVVEDTGISHRRFIEIFKKETGYTPKHYSRIRRFQEVLLLINKSRDIDWANIAISCGYYDQAHFIKDFRAFSGLNPRNYRAIPGRHHNHAFVLP